MDPWIGPAIIAAVVSGVVSAAGWFVTSWQQLRLERQRRHEKVRDFQVALRAEIETDLLNMVVVDRTTLLAEVEGYYAQDPTFSIVVPFMSRNVVFDVIVKEIHVLPGVIIGRVVLYARLRQTIENFIGDLRSDRFRELPPKRQLTMYGDYLQMLERLEALAQQAIAALDRSLALNTQDEDQSNLSSASGQGGELGGAEERGEP